MPDGADARPTMAPVTVRGRLGAALAALALAACAPLPMRPASGPLGDPAAEVAPPSAHALSPVYATEQARVETTERVWRLIGERFYDPRMNGVDWEQVRRRAVARAAVAASDAEFYAALKEMAAALGDSHTAVLTPREAAERRRFAGTRVGLLLTVADGAVAIAEVEPESPAAQAGLRPGDVLIAANGVRFDAEFVQAALADARWAHPDAARGEGPGALPADARDAQRVRLLRAVRHALRGGERAAAAVLLEVLRADGTVAQVALAPRDLVRPPRGELLWLPGEVAVIRLTRFAAELQPQLQTMLREAARAQALIVDLRGNAGGLLDMYRWFAGAFLPEDRFALRSVRRARHDLRAQHSAYLRVGPERGEGARAPLLQPLAILIDGRSASAAELTAVTLAEQRGALLVGEPSCGCAVGVRAEYVLPDGGGVRIAETGFVTALGARLEGAPLQPAVRVWPSLADLRRGVDTALVTAHRLLLDGVRSTAGAPPLTAETGAP
ncbi:MAG: S41 family peptidase [Burkholderiaceae bacterium]|nr:S41 family peptidase [Burkholderiaceae bacterium]